MDQTPSVKNTAPTSTIAPTSPIPPDSYEGRLASYTSWPHTRPGISDMAKAGFHWVPEPKWDGTECSQCGLQLCYWKEYDDPLHEHWLCSPECPFLRDLQAQKKRASKLTPTSPVGGVTRSAAPEHSMPASTSIKTPHTQATATAAAVSVSNRTTTPPSTDHSIPPPSQQILCPRYGKLNANVSPNPMEEATLDAEDWVKYEFEGEEKDEWVEV